MIHPNYKTAFILAAVLAAFLFTQSDDHRGEWRDSDEAIAVQQDEQAKASREFAGQAVCGPGALAQWVDDKTLTCTPRRGQTYTVAGGTK